MLTQFARALLWTLARSVRRYTGLTVKRLSRVEDPFQIVPRFAFAPRAARAMGSFGDALTHTVMQPWSEQIDADQVNIRIPVPEYTLVRILSVSTLVRQAPGRRTPGRGNRRSRARVTRVSPTIEVRQASKFINGDRVATGPEVIALAVGPAARRGSRRDCR